MSNIALWYTARGTGVVTLLLLTMVVALGIGSRSGRELFGLPRFAVAAVHRNAALLSVVLLGFHIVTLLLDKEAGLSIADVFVPFIGSYRPFWQGLGTVSLELIVALIVTSLLRSRMPEKVWRALHWTAYICWPVAFAHSLGTGTDTGTLWFRAIAAACAALVVAAVGWRLAPRFVELSHTRRPLTRQPATSAGRVR